MRTRLQETNQQQHLPIYALTPDTLWNTAYLELALERLSGRRGHIDRDLLAHISPALLEHVNPYGTYEFPIEAEDARSGYRPLRDPAVEPGGAGEVSRGVRT